MKDNCYVEPINKITPANQISNVDRVLLAIGGMGCQNCATRVRNSLLSLDGVFTVEVYLTMAIAEVLFSNEKVSVQKLVEAVSFAGNDGHHSYSAELVTT